MSLLALALFGLAAQMAVASAGGVSDQELMVDNLSQEPLVQAAGQRSLLAASPPPPGYCANSHIKPEFTAKVAFLMRGTRGYKKVTSGDGLNLFRGRIQRRLNRYNRAYRLGLTFTVVQKTSCIATLKKQCWFYYDVKFIVGKCGQYKFPLITQLRGDLQPTRSFLRIARLLDYPAFIKK